MRSGGGGYGRLMRAMPLPAEERRRITGQTVRRVLGFFRPYRLRVALTVLAIIVMAVIGLANPYLLKLIIDEAIPNRDLPPSLSLCGAHDRPADRLRADRRRPDLSQHPHRPARDARPAQRALRPSAAHAAALLHLDPNGRDSSPAQLRCGWCPARRHRHRDRHRQQPRDVALDRRRHVLDLLAVDADLARPAADLSRRHLQDRPDSPRRSTRETQETHRRHDVAGRGDALRQRHAAQQGLRPPASGNAALRGRQPAAD